MKRPTTIFLLLFFLLLNGFSFGQKTPPFSNFLLFENGSSLQVNSDKNLFGMEDCKISFFGSNPGKSWVENLNKKGLSMSYIDSKYSPAEGYSILFSEMDKNLRFGYRVITVNRAGTIINDYSQHLSDTDLIPLGLFSSRSRMWVKCMGYNDLLEKQGVLFPLRPFL